MQEALPADRQVIRLLLLLLVSLLQLLVLLIKFCLTQLCVPVRELRVGVVLAHRHSWHSPGCVFARGSAQWFY